MSIKRAVIRLQLDREAKDALDTLCNQRGMTQIATLSRLVRWFTRQDEVVQAAILGSLSDESIRVLAKKLLENYASPPIDNLHREAGLRPLLPVQDGKPQSLSSAAE